MAMNDYKIKISWKEFMERLKADLYITITFRRFTSKETARMRLKQFLKFLNKPNQVFFSKFILCWVFFEGNTESGGCHMHALLKGINPAMAEALGKECGRAFGLSKVVPYDHSRKNYPASEYLADKYVFYNYEDLEFFRINSRLRHKPEGIMKEVIPNETLNTAESY